MIPVGTKVSPEARERMKSICQRMGFSEYDMLQMFCDVAIRMMDDQHNLSYHMEQMITLMDGMKDWRSSVRLTDSMEKMDISEAFYVITAQGRKGTRMVNVQGKAQDMFRTEDYNMQTIVERFIEVAVPTVYRRLRLLGVELGTNTLYETLIRVVDDCMINPDVREIQETFAQDDYHDGKRMSDQQPTKQTRMTQTQKRIEYS